MFTKLTRPTRLDHVRVGDCMHYGIFQCERSASAREVAAIMAEHRVHVVAVKAQDGSAPMGMISALDLVAAAATGEELTADRIAGTEFLSVPADQPIQLAAQLMTEHGVSHLIVIDAASGEAIGIVSTFDIVSLYAG